MIQSNEHLGIISKEPTFGISFHSKLKPSSASPSSDTAESGKCVDKALLAYLLTQPQHGKGMCIRDQRIMYFVP